METKEKQFTINVKKEILKKPLYKRAKKAITVIKEATARAMHIKKDNVKVCSNLNLLIWSRGKHNPPTRFKVKSIAEDNTALVELANFEFPKKKEKKEKAESKSLKDKIQEKLGAKEDIKKQEQSIETEKEKELTKENLAVEKKEHQHELHQAPEKTKTEEQNKMDKTKGIVAWDKKKQIGEK